MKNGKANVREATHAGSWYSKDGNKLNQELNTWINSAQPSVTNVNFIKAIIGPHAGYAYCGDNAAFGYKYLLAQKQKNKTLFILGPSHHVYIKGCALPSQETTVYETPIGNLPLNTQIIETLRTSQNPKFNTISKEVQEEEHSLEMHLPYARLIGADDCTVVPIMVGEINEQNSAAYAQALNPYFNAPNTVFLISSDFCHWGKRFDYTWYHKEDGQIHESISKLDHEGMKCIESQSYKAFEAYLNQTDNTICGCNPIKLLLRLLELNQKTYGCQFVRYSQSSKVTSPQDSSVSYASAIVYN